MRGLFIILLLFSQKIGKQVVFSISNVSMKERGFQAYSHRLLIKVKVQQKPLWIAVLGCEDLKQHPDWLTVLSVNGFSSPFLLCHRRNTAAHGHYISSRIGGDYSA